MNEPTGMDNECHTPYYYACGVISRQNSSNKRHIYTQNIDTHTHTESRSEKVAQANPNSTNKRYRAVMCANTEKKTKFADSRTCQFQTISNARFV